MPADDYHDHDGGDAIHHDDPAHREYNDNLLPAHVDHLVVYQYDDEYLYDPVHHYLFDNDDAARRFAFGAAATVCVAEVPTIRINFQNTFPELAGETGTLTMCGCQWQRGIDSAARLPTGTTVDLLYPGTSVNADGSIDDVPGWILTDDGFWIRDPSDEFLRDGINLTYTVNPTATAFVTYPPESSACANPDGPFPPNLVPPIVPGQLPPTR